jgi:hypothetical protein
MDDKKIPPSVAEFAVVALSAENQRIIPAEHPLQSCLREIGNQIGMAATIAQQVEIIQWQAAEIESLGAELDDTESRRENSARNASAFEDRMGALQIENGKLRDEIAALKQTERCISRNECKKTGSPFPCNECGRKAAPETEVVAWLNAILDAIDDCPGLALVQDNWLSRRAKEIAQSTSIPSHDAELVELLREAARFIKAETYYPFGDPQTLRDFKKRKLTDKIDAKLTELRKEQTND